MFGKLLTLFAVLSVAVAVERVCSPGEHSNRDCNTCICDQDGSGYICTKRSCPQPLKQPIPLEKALEDAVEVQESCKPGETFMKECNYCSCSQNGVLKCTVKDCEAFRRRPLEEQSNADNSQCTPGETFMRDCNSCRCTKSGIPLCTMKSCEAFHQVEEPAIERSKRATGINEFNCKPGESFKKDCNSCKCSKSGVPMCTLMDCESFQHVEESQSNSQIDRKQRSADVDGYTCKPGEVFKKDCNTCKCSKSGVPMCTLMDCESFQHVEESQSNSQIDRKQRSADVDGYTCKPGESFKKDCNTCKCSKSGVPMCTLMDCESFQHVDESQSNSENKENENSSGVDEFKCKPGESYKKGCNDCHCSSRGIEICTLKKCTDPEPWGPLYEDGSECSPNEFFYSECNRCKCNTNGVSAICTLKACRQP